MPVPFAQTGTSPLAGGDTVSPVASGLTPRTSNGALVSDEPAPAEALGTLGNELRTSVVRTLFDRDDAQSFSALHEATDAPTSAGFAYHLRQLTDRYVRETADGYELTDAGRRVARHLAGGTFTAASDFDPVAVDDPCPFCGEPAMMLDRAPEAAGVACRACGETVSSLQETPAGLADQPVDERPGAFDAHHRHRVALFAAGTCPECAGPVEGDLTVGSADDGVRASFACMTCGLSGACSPTLTVLDHPTVVALHHHHGEDRRDRPVWRVRGDWSERVVSTDPPIVRVTTRLGDRGVALYLDDDVDVIHAETVHHDRSPRAAS